MTSAGCGTTPGRSPGRATGGRQPRCRSSSASHVTPGCGPTRPAGPRRQDRVVGKGDWPPLVDEDTLWAAQAVLDGAGRAPGRKSVRKHLLTGVMACGRCNDGTTIWPAAPTPKPASWSTAAKLSEPVDPRRPRRADRVRHRHRPAGHARREDLLKAEIHDQAGGRKDPRRTQQAVSGAGEHRRRARPAPADRAAGQDGHRHRASRHRRARTPPAGPGDGCGCSTASRSAHRKSAGHQSAVAGPVPRHPRRPDDRHRRPGRQERVRVQP